MWKSISSLILLVVVFSVFSGVAWFVDYYSGLDNKLPTGNPVTDVSITKIFPTKEPEFGGITLRVGEEGVFRHLAIKPIEIVDDSRCPEDVTCIWAGTMKVRVLISSGLGVSESVLELGRSITTESEEVSFTQATRGDDARLTFEVKKRVTPPNVDMGRCYIGGCSSQICSDNPDVISTCEFRAEYACYAGARCERQKSGECGWTETAELKACLMNPPAL